ncbi:MAG: hypothetical protein ABI451_04785 [Dokdonella sp.]
MTRFEYFSVLLSIIIGLGLAQLLSGIARLVRDGRSLAPAWWVMCVIATLVLAHLQIWWVCYGLRELPEWTFFSYAAFMIVPSLLYILTYLVLPVDLHLNGHELAQAFIAKRKVFFGILGLLVFSTFFQQWMLTGETPKADLDAGLRVIWLLIAVPAFLSPRILVQAIAALASLIVMMLYINLLFVQMR